MNPNYHLDISGNANISQNLFIKSNQVRTIRNFISFRPISTMNVNYTENLTATYVSGGKYQINFINGINPSNVYYSVSVSGSWNGRGDANSGMIYSVDNKTINNFIITQKYSYREGNQHPTDLMDGDTDGTSISLCEVSVSY